MLNDKIFQRQSFPEPPAEVLQTFDALEDDKYLKGDYIFRQRAYSLGSYSRHGIDWEIDNNLFHQPNNKYASNQRKFAAASDTVKKYIESILCTEERLQAIGDDVYELGIHQIRTKTEKGKPGLPCPEGPHQDGFDYVGIFSFRNHNIKGGRSELRKDHKEGPAVFETTVEPHDLLIFDDRAVFHYTFPIKPADGSYGYRDVVILTFNKKAHA